MSKIRKRGLAILLGFGLLSIAGSAAAYIIEIQGVWYSCSLTGCRVIGTTQPPAPG